MGWGKKGISRAVLVAGEASHSTTTTRAHQWATCHNNDIIRAMRIKFTMNTRKPTSI